MFKDAKLFFFFAKQDLYLISLKKGTERFLSWRAGWLAS